MNASQKSRPIKLYSEEIIDPNTEIHYAFHNSLKDITVKHTHNFYELFLIVSGEVIHFIKDKTDKLTEGSLVFIRPNDIHCYYRSDKGSCQLINLAFRQSTLKEMFNYLGEGFPSEYLVNSGMPSKVILSPVERKILKEKFEKLNTLSRDDKIKTKTYLRILLLEIFTKYFFKIESNSEKNLPDWLETLIFEMQNKDNFTKGVKKLFEIANKTPEHICRVLRTKLNTTPSEFVNELRLNYSANLLANSDESINYISLESGFENLSHFYHLFRKKFNSSPASFRKKNQKSIIPT